MGQILSSYYEKAGQINGVSAEIKLAMITKITNIRAMALPDTPENIKIFEDAFEKIKIG